MDDLKRTTRTITTRVKKTARGLDGTSVGDHVANAGDEIRKDLGNLGDGIRHATRPGSRPGRGPASKPEQKV